MNKTAIARRDELEDRKPAYALVANVDLVVVRLDDETWRISPASRTAV